MFHNLWHPKMSQFAFPKELHKWTLIYLSFILVTVISFIQAAAKTKSPACLACHVNNISTRMWLHRGKCLIVDCLCGSRILICSPVNTMYESYDTAWPQSVPKLDLLGPVLGLLLLGSGLAWFPSRWKGCFKEDYSLWSGPFLCDQTYTFPPSP